VPLVLQADKNIGFGRIVKAAVLSCERAWHRSAQNRVAGSEMQPDIALQTDRVRPEVSRRNDDGSAPGRSRGVDRGVDRLLVRERRAVRDRAVRSDIEEGRPRLRQRAHAAAGGNRNLGGASRHEPVLRIAAARNGRHCRDDRQAGRSERFSNAHLVSGRKK
jgi:hypothetical protein